MQKLWALRPGNPFGYTEVARDGIIVDKHFKSGEIMPVNYSSQVRQWTGFPLLEQASALLADILGPQSFPLAKVEWNPVQDPQGRALYRLTLRDSITSKDVSTN